VTTTSDDSPRSGTGQPVGQVGPAGEIQVISEERPPPSQVNDSIVIGMSILAALAGLAFGLSVTLDGPITLHGASLAVGLFSLAYAVRRYFTDRFPDVEAIEPRLSFDEGEGARTDLLGLTEVDPIGRRPLLRRVLIACAGVFGIGLLAPVSTLGPRPGTQLRTTAWTAGARLVTTQGEFLRPDQIATGGVATVWPEGRIGDERSATLAMRLSSAPQEGTNLDGVVDDRVVAYSKICTHAGCPVALYRERDNALFCPCHQSTFDVTRGAVPTFGPAARALPQLPLGVDDAGYIVAQGDFPEIVGPAYD